MARSTFVNLFGTAAIGILAGAAHAAQPANAADRDAGWKPVEGRIMTKWAKQVKPEAPLPEYPRPTMVRNEWQNLNGLWSYAITDGNAKRPDAGDGQILVPFPVESALSGVARGVTPEQTLWYWRTFEVPAGWRADGGRVLLHFGAVDWHAQVRVNGKKVGEHRGGFDPFSFDVTDVLTTGENQIEVEVKDPTDTGGQPRGKQWLKPHGIWYTPSSGIWQTVWLEPTPAVSIAGIEVHGSASGEIRVKVQPSRQAAGASTGIEVEVLDGGKAVASMKSDGGSEAKIRIPNVKKWSPADPHLYDLRIRMVAGGKVVDEVESYVGLRDITVGKDKHGVTRLLLNGEALFQFGPLDQGFWPDGLYTAPTDEALKFDIEAAQRMGSNMLRKHVKVEPQRFYSWCDRMGILVWQDMPSPFFRNEGDGGVQPHIAAEWKENFEREMREMVRDFSNHPSIVMWVPFNEGWGQNDLAWAREMALKVKEWDPTRLVNNASGWTDMKVGDTFDIHVYPQPALARPEENRAGVIGEFGGLGLPIEGHSWVAKDNWGYVSYKSEEELTNAYVTMLGKLPMLIGQGVSAAVYTQTTDVEIEVNGWLTYDREIWKIEPSDVKAAMEAIYAPPPKVTTVVEHGGERDGIRWRYTTQKPADNWFAADFNDAAWTEGVSGFGRDGTPGATIRTKWETSDIWIRRTFELASEMSNPYIAIHHDENAKVYINGELAMSLDGYTSGYSMIPLPAKAKSLLKRGRNTIAVHCHQTQGGQYIDVGFVDVVPAEASGRRSEVYRDERVAGFPGSGK